MLQEKHMELPTYLTIETESGDTVLQPVGNVIESDDIQVSFAPFKDGVKVYLQAKTTLVKHLKLRWNKPAPKKARILGDAWERSYGELEWRGISGGRLMPWYFLVMSENTITGYGVKVRPNAMCFWQMDTKGITLVMDVRCGGTGVDLQGRKLEVATLVKAASQDMPSFAFAKAFCHLMCDDPILPKFPVYGANNWYYAYGKSSEEEILTDTDCLMELTADLENAPFMVIDDCWQKLRCPEYIGGPWSVGNERFPDMKALAEKIRQKGARPGIWLRFLLNKDEAIQDDWRLSHNGCLDPTHPGALAFIKEDVRRTCEWGYELIKHDFSTYDLFGKWGFEMNPYVTSDGWSFYDKTKTSAEVVKLLYEAILEASKEYDAIILGCNTIGHLGAGLMHMNRTGDDTSGKNWERTRIMGVNTLAFRLPHHRTFFDVDADCVGIMGGIPWSLNREWADLVAQSGTSLFVSMKPGVLNDREKEELKSIFKMASLAKKHKEPVDWEENNCPEIWADTEETLEYNFYKENGGVSACQPRKYYVTIPIS